MRNLAIFTFAALLTIYLFSRGEPAIQADAIHAAPNGVGALETFTWQGQQPIAFQPPIGWQAGRYQQGGRNGVDYTHAGQRIAVTEYTKVGDLDGCSKLQNVLSELDTANTRTLQRRLQAAVRHPLGVKDRKLTKMLTSMHSTVSKAQDALAKNDLGAVRELITNGLRTRFKYRWRLEDYLDEVLYEQTAGGDIKRIVLDPPVDITIGGAPAVSVDFERDIEAQYATKLVQKSEVGREVYVMSNNRLFIASFQGQPETLQLFELLVSSITFPDGPCSL